MCLISRERTRVVDLRNNNNDCWERHLGGSVSRGCMSLQGIQRKHLQDELTCVVCSAHNECALRMSQHYISTRVGECNLCLTSKKRTRVEDLRNNNDC